MTEAYPYFDGALRCVGELTRPTGPGNGRALLVVHEADGIGGNVRRRCDMLARLGYVTFAADMHGGGKVLEGEAMAAAMASFRESPSLLRRRVAAAMAALEAGSGVKPRQIAAIGYCFGGLAVLEHARSGAPVAAVASFHGLLTSAAPAVRGAVQARILVATGACDPLVPQSDVDAFRAEMTAAEADWQLLVHGKAKHSYTNQAVNALGDLRMAYDAYADQLSWAALIAFLEQSL